MTHSVLWCFPTSESAKANRKSRSRGAAARSEPLDPAHRLHAAEREVEHPQRK